MKKQLKRILSMVLTTAMFIGMITVMTVGTSANSWNVTIPQRLYNAKSSYTIPTNISINAGDTLKITLGIGAIGPNTDVGIVNMSNNAYTRLGSSTTTNFSDTFTINTPGIYRIRITNNSNNQANISGYYRHTKLLNASIRYDGTAVATHTPSQMTAVHINGVSAFETQFNVKFSLNNNISRDLDLNGSTCTLNNINRHCNQNIGGEPCGPNTNCNSNNGHRKSAVRLNGINTISTSYRYRFVGHALCWWRGDILTGEHFSVIGVGNYPGKNSISSTLTSPNLARSVQHEISHNFNAEGDGTCSGNSTEWCVFKGNINFWCNKCTNEISDYRRGL